MFILFTPLCAFVRFSIVLFSVCTDIVHLHEMSLKYYGHGVDRFREMLGQVLKIKSNSICRTRQWLNATLMVVRALEI